MGASRVRERYDSAIKVLDSVACVLDWTKAARNADADAGRFLDAALLRASDMFDSGAKSDDDDQSLLLSRIQSLVGTSAIDKVEAILDAAKSLALPVPINYQEARPSNSILLGGQRRAPAPPPEHTVAVAEFKLDGEPLQVRHTLRPNILHDLDVSIRLSRWPQNAESLELFPLSVEPPDAYSVPSFRFAKPTGDPPFELSNSGRIRLRTEQSLRSRPMEFTYNVRFLPLDTADTSSLEGHRTLSLEAYDPTSHSLTGYPALDAQLLRIRDEVRRYAGIPDSELHNFLTVVRRVAQISAIARTSHLYPSKWSEREFQQDLKTRLRDDPNIGPDLEEHPGVGGGETDLSFKGIRIELKATTASIPSVNEAEPYFAQATEYVATSGRRLGVLAILECSRRTQPLGSVENDIELRAQPGANPILLCVVILRGNLARPSDL